MLLYLYLPWYRPTITSVIVMNKAIIANPDNQAGKVPIICHSTCIVLVKYVITYENPLNIFCI